MPVFHAAVCGGFRGFGLGAALRPLRDRIIRELREVVCVNLPLSEERRDVVIDNNAARAQGKTTGSRQYVFAPTSGFL